MLPKYNELDLTPFFAPFFMVFFGLCLGDSGYGLFLFLGATLYRLFAKNISATMRPVLSLIQVLAASTFFCGLLTGTFFGANIYDIDLPFFQKMKETLFMDNNDMFQLSLILGVVQILFGMVLKAVNQGIQFGIKYAVATIGWIILLISCGMGGPITGSDAAGWYGAFVHPWCSGSHDFPLQQSGKEYIPQYRTWALGFLQYGYRFTW